MDDRKRSETGQYVDEVTPEDVLSVFADVRGPVIMTCDVTKRYGCSTDTARRKLDVLYERGLVEYRLAGGRNVWWRTEETEN